MRELPPRPGSLHRRDRFGYIPTVTAATFEQVALAELPLLYRVARRLTSGHEADAEDLVGACFLKAATAWSAFDGTHPRAWLLRVLRTEHLMSLRRAASRPVLAEEEEGSEPSTEGFWREIESRLDTARILDALDRLPEEYRLPIALCDVEEMDHAEAALALELSAVALRTRLHRGRKMLRARLVRLSEPS